MDGDKYNKEVINHLKLLSKLDNTEEILVAKRKICVYLNGQSKNEFNNFKWNRTPSSGQVDIVYKQQFIHSSAAIFMMIKYPHLRKTDSFVNIIIKSDLMKECLKIALDVLTADEDCIDFIINSDSIFNSSSNIKIIDEDDLIKNNS